MMEYMADPEFAAANCLVLNPKMILRQHWETLRQNLGPGKWRMWLVCCQATVKTDGERFRVVG